MSDPIRFALTVDGLQTVFHLAGREDAAAWRLAEDVEACLGAFLVVARSGGGTLPPKVATDLEGIARSAAALRSALYELPGDLALLLDLHVLGAGAQRRIGHDLERVAEPLEDLVAVLAEVRREADEQLGASGEALDRRLLAALATAYRNRLNLRPAAEPGGHFERFVRGVLQLAAGEVPEFASLAGRTGSAEIARACAGAGGGAAAHAPMPGTPPLRG
jgi:hypothetical protein